MRREEQRIASFAANVKIMNERWTKIYKLFLLKAKFAMTSAVATVVDYTLYMLLIWSDLRPVVANVISYSIAIIVNFLLQKRYIFTPQRKVSTVFVLAISVSIGGLLLSTGLIYLLNLQPFFADHQAITKLCVTGIVFFYNFYLKRFAFEKRFFEVD